MNEIYFAHPVKTYGTNEAFEILRALKREYPNYDIIDPEDISLPSGWVSCKECMQNHMKVVFFPEIERCDKFAIWAPIVSCGIGCEIHKAWELGKEIIYVSYFAGEVEFEDMTLQDYHYTRVMTEVD